MDEQRYAVLIGNSHYPNESKLADLRFPENDVDGLHEILSSKTHGNFKEVIRLKNRAHNEALLQINKVLKRADKNDLVFLYYSGHGKLDLANRLYLCAVDTTIEALEATSIPVQAIKSYVDIAPPTKIVLVLDCCFSGAAGESFAKGSVDDQLQLVSGGRGTFVMTASTGIQAATEKESDRYGVFTKHIIEGIRSGEADLDGNGFVTVDELYKYVHGKVLDETSQEPMKWAQNVRGELRISRSGKTPRKDRRREIRKALLDAASGGNLPDFILRQALQVLSLEPGRLTQEQQEYDVLLERFLAGEMVIGEFIDDWYKVEAQKPVAKVEEPRGRLPERPVEIAKPRVDEQSHYPPKEYATTIIALVGRKIALIGMKDVLSYAKAAGAHLFFGLGLFYVDRRLRRKWVYPAVFSYPVTIIGGEIMTEGLISRTLGLDLLLLSIMVAEAVYALGFADVLWTHYQRRKTN